MLKERTNTGEILEEAEIENDEIILGFII